jgi:hypothetical protein
MKHINFKKLIFDYHSPTDYNPFGGGFKPNGCWIINKQKLINLIFILCIGFIIIYICY